MLQLDPSTCFVPWCSSDTMRQSCDKGLFRAQDTGDSLFAQLFLVEMFSASILFVHKAYHRLDMGGLHCSKSGQFGDARLPGECDHGPLQTLHPTHPKPRGLYLKGSQNAGFSLFVKKCPNVGRGRENEFPSLDQFVSVVSLRQGNTSAGAPPGDQWPLIGFSCLSVKLASLFCALWVLKLFTSHVNP